MRQNLLEGHTAVVVLCDQAQRAAQRAVAVCPNLRHQMVHHPCGNQLRLGDTVAPVGPGILAVVAVVDRPRGALNSIFLGD